MSRLQVRDVMAMKDKQQPLDQRPERLNTMDKIYNQFFGFQAGHLVIEVAEAKFTKQLSFPFFELSMQPKGQTIKTGSVDASTVGLLKWKEDYTLDVVDAHSFMVVTLFKHRKLGKPKPVAHGKVVVSDVSDGVVYSKTIELVSEDEKKKGKIGELFLKLYYTTSEQLNKSYLIAKNHSSEILKILEHNDIVCLATLCKVYDSDELAKVIIRLFNAEGQALRLLVQLCFRDLKRTRAEEELFRSDSMATKTIRQYFKMLCSDYLKSALAGPIRVLLNDPLAIEIDRTAETNTNNTESHIPKLIETCQMFLDSIVKHAHELPQNMRRFFALSRSLVKECFPSSELKSVGSFVFLRCICPAIISPNTWLVVDENETINTASRRALILVAKVLQSLANNVDFKEESLKPLNESFKEPNMKKMNQFLETVSNPDEGPKDPVRKPMTEDDKIKGLSIIVSQFGKMIKEIEAELDNDPRMKNAVTKEETKKNFLRLKQIIQESQNI